jgi:hypothetical protein
MGKLLPPWELRRKHLHVSIVALRIYCVHDFFVVILRLSLMCVKLRLFLHSSSLHLPIVPMFLYSYPSIPYIYPASNLDLSYVSMSFFPNLVVDMQECMNFSAMDEGAE